MNLLDRLQLSFRCPADWDAMEGDERRRFCTHCRKHVHNLGAMTREEAGALIAGGNVCVRMERRADGTTVVKDCPGTAAARGLAVRIAGAGLVAGGALALAGCAADEPPPMIGSLPPCEKSEIEEPGEILMGVTALPDPPDPP